MRSYTVRRKKGINRGKEETVGSAYCPVCGHEGIFSAGVPADLEPHESWEQITVGGFCTVCKKQRYYSFMEIFRMLKQEKEIP